MKNCPHSEVTEFSEAARRYCALFNFPPQDREKWVADVLASLASLYALAHKLPDLGLSGDIPDGFGDVSREEWSEVFRFVQRVLEEQEFYWCHFDPTERDKPEEKPVCGSLADDLADIYRDVLKPLRSWDALDERYLASIVFNWKVPLFGSHWGLHAVSAMRALHEIVYCRGLKAPQDPWRAA